MEIRFNLSAPDNLGQNFEGTGFFHFSGDGIVQGNTQSDWCILGPGTGAVKRDPSVTDVTTSAELRGGIDGLSFFGKEEYRDLISKMDPWMTTTFFLMSFLHGMHL